MEIKNRKAKFDYFFIENFSAGLSLVGTEVKSIREGKCNLVDSFCFFENEELFVKNMEIPQGKTNFQHDPKRIKKLLLKKKEIRKIQKLLTDGITIVPIRVFENKGWFKIEIAIAKGKKLYDKRETIKERDIKRESDRSI